MDSNKNNLIGRIQASLTALCFGLLGVFGKWAFANGFSVGELMAYRFLVASLILWLGLFIFRPQWVVIPLKQIGIFLLLGIFGYAAMSITYLTAIKGLNMTTAVLILYTYPFWVSLFSHLFTKNKISKNEILCLLLGGFGLVLLLGGNIEIKELWPALSGLLSAIIYSIYILLSEKFQNATRPLVSSAYVIFFGALTLFLIYQPSVEYIVQFSSFQLFTVIGIAFLCTIVPLTLELAALQKIQSTEFSIIMMLEPISAAVWGFFIFKEKLNLQQTLGALVILGALCLRLKLTRKGVTESHA